MGSSFTPLESRKLSNVVYLSKLVRSEVGFDFH
jgi:hypothetical protein